MMTLPILLVEDDENDVFFMKRALKQVEVTNPLFVLDNGQEAIDYLRGAGEFSDREKYPLPCLILMDFKLPKIPGPEVLKWIRAQPELRTLIVIMLSSSDLERNIQEAYQAGANSYLIKPPHSEKLIELVKLIKAYWLEVNRSPLG